MSKSDNSEISDAEIRGLVNVDQLAKALLDLILQKIDGIIDEKIEKAMDKVIKKRILDIWEKKEKEERIFWIGYACALIIIFIM